MLLTLPMPIVAALILFGLTPTLLLITTIPEVADTIMVEAGITEVVDIMAVADITEEADMAADMEVGTTNLCIKMPV